MADPAIPSVVDFERRVQVERDRLAEILSKDAAWQATQLNWSCPLCGAAVSDPAIHKLWHLRCLQ